jgi:GNAT superfamily N-acetyltransferase
VRIQKITEDELDYVRAICLDPSVDPQGREAMRSGMADRICWIRRMMQEGLEILVALEKPKMETIHYKWAGNMLHADLAVHGQVPKGLLESVPIEFAPEPVKGKNSLFIDCIWVLPPFWHTGVAKRLIKSFIHSAKQFGGASVLAYECDRWFGTSIKYMPSSFFKRFGFKEVARDGSRVLLSLDLGAGVQPKLIYPRPKPFDENNKVTIDALVNSQCPWSRLMIDNIKRNAKKYPGVTVNIVKTDDRKTIEEFGLSRGTCINGKPVIKRMASWKEIRTEIEKIQKLG